MQEERGSYARPVLLASFGVVVGADVNVHEVLQVIDSPLLLVNPQGQEVHSQVRSIATLDYTQRDFYLAFVRDGHQGVFVGEPQSLRPLGPLVLAQL